LAERLDAQQVQPGQGVQFLARDGVGDDRGQALGPPVTIADGVLKERAVAGEQAEVDRPRVDPDAGHPRPEPPGIGRHPLEDVAV